MSFAKRESTVHLNKLCMAAGLREMLEEKNYHAVDTLISFIAFLSTRAFVMKGSAS